MRKRALLILLSVGACRSEPAPVDTTQRSMSVPVPSRGTAGAVVGSEHDLFRFPKRAKQDPSAITVRSIPAVGAYIADANGRAFYSFSGDEAGHSACVTNCATVWPPVIVTRLPRKIDGAIAAGHLTLTGRPDGTRQLVFSGMPLYYFESDRQDEPPGGHDAMSFGGRFALVSPDGKPLASAR
jgi:predicted lipoprotein with Yx(FWY)xxD motif